MRSTVFTAALLAFLPAIHSRPHDDASSGCNTALPDGVKPDSSVNRTLENSKSGEPTRKYRIHLPPNYDNTQAVPLILSFHGRTQDALYQEKLSRFSEARYGFEGISVYPEGVPIYKNNKPIQQWEGDPESKYISDTTFTLELLKELKSTYCIDPSKIYSSGKSNGGGFTGILACNKTTASHIAAFAAAAPAVYLNNKTDTLDACKPGRKVPFMELHGLKDGTANYTGGLNSRSNGYTTDIVTYVNSLAKVDGFKPSENSTDTLCRGDAGKTVTKFTWDGAKETLVHYRYENVAHDWMSATENEDTNKTSQFTCKEAEATTLMLAWFAKWTL